MDTFSSFIRKIWRILEFFSSESFLEFARHILPWIIAVFVLSFLLRLLRHRPRKVRLAVLLAGCAAVLLLQRFWEVLSRVLSNAFFQGLAGDILAWALVIIVVLVLSGRLAPPYAPAPPYRERVASIL